MTRLWPLILVGWLAGSSFAVASPDDARPSDLRELQADLVNLDEELASIDAEQPSASRFRERAEEIREETIYLKVKMRRHQRAQGAGTGVDYDEVEQLRRSIDDLRDEIAAGQQRDTRELVLPEGTEMVVRLEDALSSRTARPEDRVTATVAQPVRTGRRTAIPAGVRVRGVVRDVEAARRPSKSGRLELEFDTLYLGRERLDLRSRVVAIDDQLADRRTTERKAGIGAVLGGALGAILGGAKGAIIGVVLGGGGTVVATKGDDVELPAGTLVTIRLTRPLTVPEGRDRGADRGTIR